MRGRSVASHQAPISPRRARLVLVAAIDRERGIGRGNAMPWHLPDDFRHFRALTLGRPVLMGRRTAESLGRALPGRTNLVLTRSGRVPFDGMQAVASLDAAIAIAADQGADELCVLAARERIGTGEAADLAALDDLRLLIWPREQNPEYHDLVLGACRDNGVDPQVVESATRFSGSYSYLLTDGQAFALVPTDYAREAPASLAWAPLRRPARLPHSQGHARPSRGGGARPADAAGAGGHAPSRPAVCPGREAQYTGP